MLNQPLSSNKQYHTHQPLLTLSPHEPNHHQHPEYIPRQSKPPSSQPIFSDIRGQHAQQIQIYLYQIETLKQHLQSQQQQNGRLQQIILDLKRQISTLSKQNNKFFQQNEKNRQLVEKLKIDNKSMQMQIDKFRGERKIYYNKMNDIDGLKRQIEEKMTQKNMAIDDLVQKVRKLQRGNLQMGMKCQQLEKGARLCEEEKRELKGEVKQTLQKYLACSNLSNRMEYQLKEVNQVNRHMKDKIYELQKERQEYRLRLGLPDQNSISVSATNHSSYPQRSMLQIQSYMKEIENVLDLKASEAQRKRKNYQKLKLSIECLENNL